jgi:copper(I)-binding protein
MKRGLLLLTMLAALCGTAWAHQFKIGDLVIGHPWTRATPGGASVGAGYLKITNNGKEADRLTGGTLDGADTVEIHEMKMEGDTMIMRQAEQGVEIKPGETIEFKPGSYHLMFIGLKKPIAQGPNIKGTLNFEKAGSVAVEYKVEGLGAQEPTDNKHDHMQ